MCSELISFYAKVLLKSFPFHFMQTVITTNTHASFILFAALDKEQSTTAANEGGHWPASTERQVKLCCRGSCSRLHLTGNYTTTKNTTLDKFNKHTHT